MGVAVLGSLAIGHLAVVSPTILHLRVSVAGSAALAMGLMTAGIILWRPGVGFVLLVIVVYLNLSDVLIRFHDLPSILQLIGIPLVVAAWRVQREPTGAGSVRGLTIPLVIYALVLLFSSTVARDPALADARTVEIAKATLLYFLVYMLASRPSLVRRGARTMVVAGVALAGLGLAQLATGFEHTFGGLARVEVAHIHGSVFEPRMAGPLGDPNFFAQILILPVPVALMLASVESRSRRKMAMLLGGGLLTLAVLLTYSRGAALALGLVLACVWLAGRISLGRILVGAALVLALIVALPRDFTQRLATVTQILPGSDYELDPDSSFENRRLLADTAWRMFLDHPWFGVGAGNYTVHFPAYADRAGIRSGEYEDPGGTHYPHSLYLETAAESGVLGLAALALVLGSCMWHLRRARARYIAAGLEIDAALARAFEISIAGFLVSSLFLHGHFPRYLWLLFGFAAALYRLAPADAKSASRAPDRTGVS